MADILGYVTSIFEALFTPTTGYVAKTISLIVGSPYLMVGLSLMIAGSAVSFLRKIIRSTNRSSNKVGLL